MGRCARRASTGRPATRAPAICPTFACAPHEAPRATWPPAGSIAHDGPKRGPNPFLRYPCWTRQGSMLADILLVDDETLIHEIYTDFLQLHGHKVVGIAYNGEEAVALFR